MKTDDKIAEGENLLESAVTQLLPNTAPELL